MGKKIIRLSNGNSLHITETPAEPVEYAEHDPSGAKVRRQTSDGAWSAWSRDGENRSETHHHADGTWWTATYNARGERIHQVGSDGTVYMAEYNEDGLLVREVSSTSTGLELVETTA